jgi:hypothetical protein
VRPDGKNQSWVMSDEAIGAGALYGTPDEIAVKLEALRAAGAVRAAQQRGRPGLPAALRARGAARPSRTRRRSQPA